MLWFSQFVELKKMENTLIIPKLKSKATCETNIRSNGDTEIVFDGPANKTLADIQKMVEGIASIALFFTSIFVLFMVVVGGVFSDDKFKEVRWQATLFLVALIVVPIAVIFVSKKIFKTIRSQSLLVVPQTGLKLPIGQIPFKDIQTAGITFYDDDDSGCALIITTANPPLQPVEIAKFASGQVANLVQVELRKLGMTFQR
jgi:hypothetical protein